MTTKQILLSLDKKENKIVEDYAYKHRLSKANSIKMIILESVTK